MSREFTENCLIATIYSSHLDSVDQFFPLVEAIVDVVYGNESSSENIELFASYMGLRALLQKDFMSPSWSEQELNSLCEKFRDFKKYSDRTRHQILVRKSLICLIIWWIQSVMLEESNFFTEVCMGLYSKKLNDCLKTFQENKVLSWMKRLSDTIGKW